MQRRDTTTKALQKEEEVLKRSHPDSAPRMPEDYSTSANQRGADIFMGSTHEKLHF